MQHTFKLHTSNKTRIQISQRKLEGLSKNSILSVGVPGTVAGLGYIHKKYGSLEWKKLLLPSILLAKYGFTLDPHNVSILNNPQLKVKLS